nr:uncharacterized protein LOC129523816 isoform X2 [Gorilla gorilla gorilla]
MTEAVPRNESSHSSKGRREGPEPHRRRSSAEQEVQAAWLQGKEWKARGEHGRSIKGRENGAKQDKCDTLHGDQPLYDSRCEPPCQASLGFQGGSSAHTLLSAPWKMCLCFSFAFGHDCEDSPAMWNCCDATKQMKRREGDRAWSRNLSLMPRSAEQPCPQASR